MQPSFGRGERSGALKSEPNVAPNSYEQGTSIGGSPLSNVRSAPSFSIKSRRSLSESPGKADIPGPAAYSVPTVAGTSVVSTIRSPPAYSLRPRTQGAKNLNESLPGPLDYSPSESHTRASSPSYSMRRKTRPLDPKPNNDIGPAGFVIQNDGSAVLSTRPHSPSFSLRPRTVDPAEIARAHSPNPSPADYTVPPAVGYSNVWTNTGGAFSMRSRTREPRKQELPGPSDYDVPSSIGQTHISDYRSPQSFVFRGSEKLIHKPVGSTPDMVGPSSYSVPSVFSPKSERSPFKSSGSGPSLRSRPTHGSPTEAALHSSSPGPAAYLPEVLHNNTQPHFGKSERLQPTAEIKHRSSTPGVGSYRIDDRPISRSSPSWSMRSRTQSPTKLSEELGPAAYNLQGSALGNKQPTRSSSPAFSIKMRWPSGRTNDNPGPGTYGTLHLPHLESLYQRTAHLSGRISPLISTARSSFTMNGSPSRHQEGLEKSSFSSSKMLDSMELDSNTPSKGGDITFGNGSAFTQKSGKKNILTDRKTSPGGSSPGDMMEKTTRHSESSLLTA